MERIPLDDFEIGTLYLDRVHHMYHEAQTHQMFKVHVEQLQLSPQRQLEEGSTRGGGEKFRVLDDEAVHVDLLEGLNFDAFDGTIGEVDLLQVLEIGERVGLDHSEVDIGE